MIDTLIQNGKVIDGAGNPWFMGEIAIQGDRIAAVVPNTAGNSRFSPDDAHEVIDAQGLAVCPGFIDIMSHSILPLMHDGRSLSKVTQGVTTEIMGEGWTPAPFGGRTAELDTLEPRIVLMEEWRASARSWSRFGDWLDAVVSRGTSVNVGSFLGGATLRAYAKGTDPGAPSADELDVMRRVMQDSMEDGAFGLACALIYPPECYITTAELIEVCKVVAAYGGLYISHIRSEGERVLEAVEEILEIGRSANLPVQIYHLKVMGQQNWHLLSELLEKIRSARARDQDITADMYPYSGSGAGLMWGLPPWLAEGGDWLARLRDPLLRDRIREDLKHPQPEWEALITTTGINNIRPVGFRCPENQIYRGQTLAEIAQSRQQHWTDALIDLLLSERQEIAAFWFDMDEANLTQQISEPWLMISSDAGGIDPQLSDPAQIEHPRAFGTFPRVLGHYVRERGLLTLEDAVRKMTSFSANRLGISDRGLLRAGFFADVVMFDPNTIRDRATFTEPHQLSTGIRQVWVNGKCVVSSGEHTGAMPGRFIKRN